MGSEGRNWPAELTSRIYLIFSMRRDPPRCPGSAQSDKVVGLHTPSVTRGSNGLGKAGGGAAGFRRGVPCSYPLPT